MENIVRSDKHSIILVEDDHDQRRGLSEYLQMRGFDVVEAASGVEFHAAFENGQFDVAILDVNLPDISGFALARHLADSNDIGIIMLTARRSSEDRRTGYEGGADIYFAKPVDSEELALAAANLAIRIRRETARNRPDTSVSAAPLPSPQAWALDRRACILTSPQSKFMQLSSKEALLLEYLADRPNETVSRTEILSLYGGPDADAKANTRRFDMAFSRLRTKARQADIELPLQIAYGMGVRSLETVMVK